MKLSIYDPSSIDQVVQLCLVRSMFDADTICLVAVDSDGKALHNGYILSVSPNGLHRHHKMSSSIGFPLNDQRQIGYADADG